MQSQQTAFLFDLDGTLVDSVYQHVLAWREALEAEGIELSVWRIHRKIGMSGGLLTNMLLRETGLQIDPDRVDRLQRRHAAAYNRHSGQIRPLPGARELLACLTETGIAWAIATSGRMETARFALQSLGVDCRGVPIVTRDQVKHAKPDPICFWPLRNGWGLGSRHRRSSATACGICWLLGEPARSASVFCQAATARKSWSAPAPIESTQTRPTF
jgi:beta-phosphoglucomutase-like phosphatase (HAD superfamily)